jgi:hypothetical protein
MNQAGRAVVELLPPIRYVAPFAVPRFPDRRFQQAGQQVPPPCRRAVAALLNPGVRQKRSGFLD